ncbi:MAG: GTP cyclohydrolase II [Rhodobacteraceae bacterium]|nr:GTP cyclohydrolase II [Paracoccaceae bacterium]
MALALSFTERLARARSDLRMGVPVVLTDAGRRSICVAAETADSRRIEDLRAKGLLTLAITERRAETLKARAYDGDTARLLVPEDADATWIRAVVDPAEDLTSPMKGPFKSARGGAAEFHRTAIALVKSAHLLPAALVVEGVSADGLSDLTRLDLDEFSQALADASPMDAVVQGRVPMEASQAGRVHVFRPEDGSAEHYAIEIGRPDRTGPVLVRLHSACFTGDVLGSLKCDCGAQLKAALAEMGREGAGILLYLNQEGRGIGLANKMRAYALQDQGFDTVEANHRLGFEDDERDFRIGATILRKMGVSQVRLMTNNPAKVDRMADCGIEVVERVALKVGQNPLNEAYLDVKARKSGHLL